MWGLELAIVATMICINRVFGRYEIAFASVSLARLQWLADNNRAGAKIAVFMKQNMNASLAVFIANAVLGYRQSTEETTCLPSPIAS